MVDTRSHQIYTSANSSQIPTVSLSTAFNVLQLDAEIQNQIAKINNRSLPQSIR